VFEAFKLQAEVHLVVSLSRDERECTQWWTQCTVLYGVLSTLASSRNNQKPSSLLLAAYLSLPLVRAARLHPRSRSGARVLERERETGDTGALGRRARGTTLRQHPSS
jgi:hypothetical protein